MMMLSDRLVFYDDVLDHLVGESLFVVAAALLAVGLVHGTIVRHVVQTLPLGLAYLVSRFRPAFAAPAAAPPLVFWITIMILIWLARSGVTPLVPANYERIEMGFTVVTAAAALLGVVGATRMTRRNRLRSNSTLAIGVAAAFTMIQLLTIWVSFRLNE